MATLAGNTIASTYPLLLKVDSNGLDGTLRAIQDGDATDSVLYLATDSALISGNGTKLYFFDADGGEHISADNAGNLTIAAGADTSDLITLDSTGSIVLNADGGQVQFHDGSDEIGVFENSSSNFVIESKVQDKDIIFKGNDGGSGITAMTIDMDVGGTIGVGTTSPTGNVEISGANGAQLDLSSVKTSIGGTDPLGTIRFRSHDSDNSGVLGQISTTIFKANPAHTTNIDGTDGEHTEMIFKLGDDVGSGISANMKETMRLRGDAGNFAMSIDAHGAYGLSIDSQGSTSSHDAFNITNASDSAIHTMYGDGSYRTTGGVRLQGSALSTGDTGISSSGSGGNLRMFHNGTQLATLSQYGLGINCNNAGEVTTSGTSQRYLAVDGGSGGGVVALRTSTNADDTFMGAVDWVNAANGDSSTNNAAGRLSAAIRAYTDTDDSNASDDSGAHMLFYTKPMAGSLTLRFSINAEGFLTSYGSFLPASNNSYNLGSASLRWSVLYTSNSVNVSDETLKTDIQDCDLGIDFVNTLKPKSFKMKDLEEEHDDYDKKHYGLIAQDLKDGKFKDSVYGDKDGEYGLAYNDLIAPLIKAVQELSAKVEALENA